MHPSQKSPVFFRVTLVRLELLGGVRGVGETDRGREGLASRSARARRIGVFLKLYSEITDATRLGICRVTS